VYVVPEAVLAQQDEQVPVACIVPGQPQELLNWFTLLPLASVIEAASGSKPL
jgi:hypothetical protein